MTTQSDKQKTSVSNYLNDDVFLDTPTAKRLYHEVAKKLPIIDFHTHLPEKEIAEDHRFENIWELWLKHDHYKWRLMRGCGVEETYITGDASPKEKFLAFAKIMPLAYGNPVHHWAHLELQRVFEIYDELSEETAEAIWNEANQQLATKHSVCDLLKNFNVELICTTDDPTFDLLTHRSLAEKSSGPKVFPTFRPDPAHAIDNPKNYRTWIAKLEVVSGIAITNINDLINALKQRHDHFHESGCRLSDHGISYAPASTLSEAELNEIFVRTLGGATPTDTEHEAFTNHILTNVAQWNFEKSWTMQLHLGPQRNVNSNMFPQTGRDSGYDTMGSWPQTAKLISFLDSLNSRGILGRTIVYNLNPNESDSLCCALQNFQNSTARGLVQYGPAWWHLDHVRGIREQLDILTNLGAIGTSIGMLTDSRSFTSYVRHEYYRRMLCQYIGKAAENGEMPNNSNLLDNLVSDICYHNPRNYFNWNY